ncbi:AMP-binding protein [Lolliginicoccus levis]|uniref:AMP-binding protein n=1 Tax=Lolliginicoccus levis TaxID=2919542 RepID=UPI00241CC947|nr:AMP-binding protein [Lolliginicoccus levis]
MNPLRSVPRAAGLARSARAMIVSGIVPLTRPDLGLRSLSALRREGPFVGAIQVPLGRAPHSIALIDDDGPITYWELDQRATALARAWGSCGLGTGSVVATLCRDHRYLVITMLAVGKLGARLVLLNTGFSGPQLRAIAERENVDALVHDSEFDEVATHAPASVTTYLGWHDPDAPARRMCPAISDLMLFPPTLPLPRPRAARGFILLTSGTTGVPKGAPRERTSILSTAQFLDRIPLRAGGVTVIATPAFHGTGLSQLLIALALGSTVVLARRFDPATALAAIEQHRADSLIVVPTMLHRMLEADAAAKAQRDTSSLRVILTAGSALAPELQRRATARFGDVVHNLYGSTEVAVASVATPDELRRAPGTVGRPPAGCQVILVDDDGNEVTGAHRRGRVFVGSGLSFEGYTDGRSRETYRGLLDTGDIGHWDWSGLLYIDGRADDMIVSGGENIHPVAVENSLLEHPGVSDAAVIGVPDADFGQRLRAYVVPGTGSGGAAGTFEDSVREHIRFQLGRLAVPRDVIVVESLPRNATGKLLRSVLQDTETVITMEDGARH